MAPGSGCLVEDGLEDDGGGAPVEGALPGRKLVEHGAEGEEIAPGVERLPAGLLRRHVVERPQRGAGARQLPAGNGGRRLRVGGGRGVEEGDELRQAEVEDLGLAGAGHEDVGGLDVAVDDPLGVGRVEPVDDLDGQVQQPLHPHRAALDEVLERLALEQLHDDERLALVLPDLVNRADVGVVERGRRAGLAKEAVERGAVAGGLGRQELQGDGPAEDAVVGPVDDAHAAATELLDDPVVRNFPADHDASREGGIVWSAAASSQRRLGRRRPCPGYPVFRSPAAMPLTLRRTASRISSASASPGWSRRRRSRATCT